MCANEVQFQLQQGYVNELKKNPGNLQRLINEGSIIDNGDGTYSTTNASLKSVGVFDVEGAGGVKETKTLDSATPAKGLGVEHSAAKAKEGVKEEKTVTFKLDDFVKQSGLAEDKRAELVKEFEAAGLSIDKEKGIVTYDKTKYDTAITKFAKNNRLSYLSTNEDGKAIADKLAKDGKITLNEDGGYVINGAEGKKAVDEAFPTQTQAPVETRENKSVKINSNKFLLFNFLLSIIPPFVLLSQFWRKISSNLYELAPPLYCLIPIRNRCLHKLIVLRLRTFSC